MTTFQDAVAALIRGDFSASDYLFEGDRPPIVAWVEDGSFEGEPQALAEALACACFNGRDGVAEYLLSKGVRPEDGDNTGMNAFHWAANRGQIAAVKVLVAHNSDMEALNSYGGTVLDCTVWSAIHEPNPNHLEIIKMLIEAGADQNAVVTPTGRPDIDALFRS